MHCHGVVQQAFPDAVYHRGAGSGSAGQGFPCASLEHPQFDFIPVHNLHEADIGLFRESGVGFKDWPQGRYRCLGHVIDNQHSVGIAQ